MLSQAHHSKIMLEHHCGYHLLVVTSGKLNYQMRQFWIHQYEYRNDHQYWLANNAIETADDHF